VWPLWPGGNCKPETCVNGPEGLVAGGRLPCACTSVAGRDRLSPSPQVPPSTIFEQRFHQEEADSGFDLAEVGKPGRRRCADPRSRGGAVATAALRRVSISWPNLRYGNACTLRIGVAGRQSNAVIESAAGG